MCSHGQSDVTSDPRNCHCSGAIVVCSCTVCVSEIVCFKHHRNCVKWWTRAPHKRDIVGAILLLPTTVCLPSWGGPFTWSPHLPGCLRRWESVSIMEHFFSRLWTGSDPLAPPLSTPDGLTVKIQHSALVSGGCVRDWYFTGETPRDERSSPTRV